MTREYKSMTRISRNKEGKEELVLEYEMGYWEWFRASLNAFSWLPLTVTERWINSGTQWVEKETRKPASQSKQLDLFYVKGALKNPEFGWIEMQEDVNRLYARSIDDLIDVQHPNKYQ